MAISLVAVGKTITAALVNQIITAVNGTAMTGIVPTTVAGTGVTVTANGAVTFTNATAVSLNGVFSGTYDNYRVTWTSTTRSQNVGMYIRLRQAGVDNTGTVYDYAQQKTSGSATVAPVTSSSASGARLDDGVAVGQRSSGVMDLFGPALAGGATLGTVQASVLAASALTMFATSLACEATSSSDGITFYPGAGTFSGMLRVYGYNNLT